MIIITIIIIIIIIIFVITFMYGIYNYIPETNHISRYIVLPAVLYLLLSNFSLLSCSWELLLLLLSSSSSSSSSSFTVKHEVEWPTTPYSDRGSQLSTILSLTILTVWTTSEASPASNISDLKSTRTVVQMLLSPYHAARIYMVS